MTKLSAPDMVLIQSALSGSNFRKLLLKKKVTKYAIARDCRISYRTLCFWQKGTRPSPKNDTTYRVAEYLGLIKPRQAEVMKLLEEIKSLQIRLARMIEELNAPQDLKGDIRPPLRGQQERGEI